jgi:hypothetical protein
MKDFYDLFMLVKTKWNDIDKNVLILAIKNTSIKRGTDKLIERSTDLIGLLENDSVMIKLWYNYRDNYRYAENISYDDLINAIKTINDLIK